MIDEILRAGFGGIGHGLRGFALGADEEDAAAFGHDVGDGEQATVSLTTSSAR